MKKNNFVTQKSLKNYEKMILSCDDITPKFYIRNFELSVFL